MREIGNIIEACGMERARAALGKAAIAWLAAMLLAVSLAACSVDSAATSAADAGRSSSTAASAQVASNSSSSSGKSSSSASKSGSVSVKSSSSSSEASSSSKSEAVSETRASSSAAPEVPAFDLADVAPYAGKASTEVNGGTPFFTDADRARDAFEEYSPLDAHGRCGVAFALVGLETMPTEERGSIGMVKPSGWQTVRYDGLVDGNYLYNRCHLIGYQLTGENANERNLITGTRSMNLQGMLPYEDRVASYVERTGNHVLYRSTPVFEGDELVARGVLLEAESVEDGGAGVRFCAWCYNVEPGIEIDYANGDSRLVEGAAEGETEAAAEAAPEPDAAADPVTVEPATATYILNTNTHKFHYPSCPSVDDMAEHNKQVFEGTRDEAIDMGYVPCKRCNP